MNLQTVSSPKSPLQQKTKFHNQLANMETNYTPEKRNLSPYSRYTDNTPNVQILPPKQPSQPLTQLNNHQFSAPNKTTEIVQQNYSQSNYTYKPLNLPPRPIEQKDNSTYKPQNYQPNIQPYQQVTQIYQPNTQPNQPLNDTSANQRNMQPQVYPYQTAPSVKTYSPYFPVGNTNAPKTSTNYQTTQGTEVKTNQVYQTYTYSGFPPSQSPTIRPLTNNENNYIKINTNYVSPLEKYENKTEQRNAYNLNGNYQDWNQKENLKPTGLGIEGIKYVESKIY